MVQAANQPRESGSSDPDLGAQLRVAVGLLYRRFRSERPDGSLGDKALDVLTYLHKHGPRTLTELSGYDHVAPASMSQTLNRLTEAGYAVRAGDPSDRRKVLFRTTAEGAAVAAASASRRNAWLDSRLAELSTEDRSAIARASEVLGRIADS